VRGSPREALRGVGFFSRGWHGGRDARVPSVARAGSASVSLAWRQRCAARQRREQARPQKTYPFEPRGRGGSRGSSPVHGGGWEGGMLKNQRKDTYYQRKRLAGFPSRSGGNLQKGGNCKLRLRDW